MKGTEDELQLESRTRAGNGTACYDDSPKAQDPVTISPLGRVFMAKIDKNHFTWRHKSLFKVSKLNFIYVRNFFLRSRT